MIWHAWLKNTLKFVLVLGLMLPFSCQAQKDALHNEPRAAAQNTAHYLPLLQGKKVGLVANQTSVIISKVGTDQQFTHLADSLQLHGIELKKVFAPEHGFRGTADAGAHIDNGVDKKTGLPVISLYGKRKKPLAEDLRDIELMVFDIQDVGARFYTYISTLHYVMEACAEQNIPLIVLDRPNPNAHYIDGPVLKKSFSSFVGMHPVPIVYGMTIGEYAQMINGEHWLSNGIQANLMVIPVEHYSHKTPYSLPIPPSPNLRSDQAIALYPSLCLFEGTIISAGRGTDRPFELFGAPGLDPTEYPFNFQPKSGPGSQYPKFEGEPCQGLDLGSINPPNYIELDWLIETYKAISARPGAETQGFFNDFFEKLAGTDQLKKDILNGLSPETIRAGWEKEIQDFKKLRAKYLLYSD